MSRQKSVEDIDKIALEFITVYKRYKEKSHSGSNKKRGILLNSRKKEKRDKHPC
jgi:hypothetical protein